MLTAASFLSAPRQVSLASAAFERVRSASGRGGGSGARGRGVAQVDTLLGVTIDVTAGVCADATGGLAAIAHSMGVYFTRCGSAADCRVVSTIAAALGSVSQVRAAAMLGQGLVRRVITRCARPRAVPRGR